MWDRLKKALDRLMRRGVVIELTDAQLGNIDWVRDYTKQSREEVVSAALSYYTTALSLEMRHNKIAWIAPNGATQYFVPILPSSENS